MSPFTQRFIQAILCLTAVGFMLFCFSFMRSVLMGTQFGELNYASQESNTTGGTQPQPQEAQEPWASSIIDERNDSLVLIKGSNGSGSGFVCKYRGQTCMITNVHVMAGVKMPAFTRLKGASIKISPSAAAVDHDIFCMEVPSDSNSLEALDVLENKVSVGDEIVVLGNTWGDGVVLPLYGKVAAIGPNLVEVTAEFQPGNSGSPIIHRKTGKVIGVVSYLVHRELSLPNAKQMNDPVRRFGYRLDTVRQWQQIQWAQFEKEAGLSKRAEEMTHDLADLARMMGSSSNIPAQHKNPAIASALQRLNQMMYNRSLPVNERLRAASLFFEDMKSTCRSDLLSAKSTLQFDFFRKAAEKELQKREAIAEFFTQIGNTLPQQIGY
jgi:hypothetical protein